MGSKKLTAGERERLRTYCAWDGFACPGDADELALRLLAEHASLERELAELREAASRLLGWLDNETIDGLPAHESDYFSLDTRVSVIAMRALLPAASEPAKEPSDG